MAGAGIAGDRCWIAPEIAYNVQDRRDFGGTWHIPATMDPGEYQLTPENGSVSLTADIRLTAYAHQQALGTTRFKSSALFAPRRICWRVMPLCTLM